MVSETDRVQDEDVAERFYRAALTEAERADFPEALEVEGVDEEIALLRLRLREALKERPEDLLLAFKGVELLTRIVAVRYRLPGAQEKALRRATAKAIVESGLEPEKRDE